MCVAVSAVEQHKEHIAFVWPPFLMNRRNPRSTKDGHKTTSILYFENCSLKLRMFRACLFNNNGQSYTLTTILLLQGFHSSWNIALLQVL